MIIFLLSCDPYQKEDYHFHEGYSIEARDSLGNIRKDSFNIYIRYGINPLYDTHCVNNLILKK